MANEEHLAQVRRGSFHWNYWREKNPKVRPDLSKANLSNAKLGCFNFDDSDLKGARFHDAEFSFAKVRNADLSWTMMSNANVSNTDFCGSNFQHANLHGLRAEDARFIGSNLAETELANTDLLRADLGKATLAGANLRFANFSYTTLQGTDLSNTNLHSANFNSAKLEGTDFSDATLYHTALVNLDLSRVVGLDTCRHEGPSSIDEQTLVQSGTLPLALLKGCGLTDRLIEYLPSLTSQAIQFYSCFISYASKDDEFAKRLHADLQDNGVRCWFAPEDMKIGDPVRSTVDQAIRLRDKLVLILSETAIDSDWVEHEVDRALEEEARREQLVLFPIQIDNAIKETKFGWAKRLRAAHKPTGRHIGDFTSWKDHDSYKKAFDRLLRDLRVEGDNSE